MKGSIKLPLAIIIAQETPEDLVDIGHNKSVN